MTIKSDDVLTRLKDLGYAPDESDLTLIQFAISGTEQYIKNFCNISEIPAELYYVAVDMAAGSLLRTKYSLGFTVCDSIDFEGDKVKSLTEGDISITFNSDGSLSNSAKYLALLERLCNRDDELITFRRLRW